MDESDGLWFWMFAGAVAIGSLVGIVFRSRLLKDELRSLQQSGSEAEGEVIEVAREAEGEWIVVYRFRTKRGQQLERSEFAGLGSAAPYRVGVKVKVLYDPNAPDTSRLA